MNEEMKRYLFIMKNKEIKVKRCLCSCKFCPSHHWPDGKIHIFLVFPLRAALFTRRAGTSARAIWQIHQIRFLVTRLLCWTLVFRGQASLFRLSPTGVLTDVDKQKCNTSASHSSPQQKGGRRTDGRGDSGRDGGERKKIQKMDLRLLVRSRTNSNNAPFSGDLSRVVMESAATNTLFSPCSHNPWLAKNKSHLSTLFSDSALLRGSRPNQTSQKSDSQSRRKSHKIIFMPGDSCSKSLIECGNPMYRERERADVPRNPQKLVSASRWYSRDILHAFPIKWNQTATVAAAVFRPWCCS